MYENMHSLKNFETDKLSIILMPFFIQIALITSKYLNMKVGNDVPEEIAQISVVRVTRGVAVPCVGRHQL